MSARAAAAARRLALRARRDLVMQPMRLRGTRVWAVKDPMSSRYYHLQEREAWLLGRLDGTQSFDEILALFNRQFAPQVLPPAQLDAFLSRLHREGLIESEAPGQGSVLWERAGRLARVTRWRRLANPLAIRFRGINPRRFLGWLNARLGWVFSSAAVAACWLVTLSAAFWFIAHFEQAKLRLPELDAWLTPAGLGWLLVAISITKVLHELGHGLACTRAGGECRELGLMFLCFSPCLYCNVSDTWLVPGKWRRAAVGAAGIHVELLLAGIAFWLWWFSNPGSLNSLCGNIMLVASFNTLVINGNPLMRFDGYFVLSDLAEVPNLAQEANAALGALFVQRPENSAWPREAPSRRWALAAYAAASWVYRCGVLLGLYLFFRGAAANARLRWGVDLLLTLVLAGWLTGPFVRGARMLSDQYWRRRVRYGRVLGAMVILVLVGLWPWPLSVRAPAILQIEQAQAVYVTVPGNLASTLAPGQHVEAGQVIAVLKNAELERELLQLEVDLSQQQQVLLNLRLRQGFDLAAATRLPEAEKALADLEERVARRKEDQARLVLVAPRAGVILPPRWRAATTSDAELPRWSGTPLEPSNVGCYLESGTQLCEVGDPGQLEALAVIEQHDVALVRPGQCVGLLIEQLPGMPASGLVREISERNLDALPEELAASGRLPALRGERGALRPAEATYVARVRLDHLGWQPLRGAPCIAKISVAPQSLARRFWRFLLRTARLA